MHFEFEAKIALPAQQVYTLLRTRLTELTPHLPAVDDIEELEREEAADGTVNVCYRWQGNRSGMPVVIRPFVTRTMLAWRDHARWPGTAHEVHWEFEPAKFKTLYACAGVTYIEAVSDSTCVLRITGDLKLYPARFPGISERMAKRLEPKLTPWVLEKIRPNLLQVPIALQSFVAAESC